MADDITWVEEAKAAALSDVLKVHEWAYVKQIQSTHTHSYQLSDALFPLLPPLVFVLFLQSNQTSRLICRLVE